MICFICEEDTERGHGNHWQLNGFAVDGMKFWGTFCRKCFYKISQTPNHKIVDQELFNEVAVIYQLKR